MSLSIGQKVKAAASSAATYVSENKAKSAGILLGVIVLAVGGYFGVDQIIQNHEKIGAFFKHDVVQFLSDNQERFEGAGMLLGAGLAIYGVRAAITWARSGKKTDTAKDKAGEAAGAADTANLDADSV